MSGCFVGGILNLSCHQCLHLFRAASWCCTGLRQAVHKRLQSASPVRRSVDTSGLLCTPWTFSIGCLTHAASSAGSCLQCEAHLADESLVVFVCSTTGNGEPPDNMRNFWCGPPPSWHTLQPMGGVRSMTRPSAVPGLSCYGKDCLETSSLTSRTLCSGILPRPAPSRRMTRVQPHAASCRQSRRLQLPWVQCRRETPRPTVHPSLPTPRVVHHQPVCAWEADPAAC